MATRFQGHATGGSVQHCSPANEDHFRQYRMSVNAHAPHVIPHPMPPPVCHPALQTISGRRPAPSQAASLHHPSPPATASWRHSTTPLHGSNYLPTSPYPYPIGCGPPSRLYMMPYPQMNYLYNEQALSKDIIELESPLTSTQVHVSTMYPYGYTTVYPYFMAHSDMQTDKPKLVSQSVSEKIPERGDKSPSGKKSISVTEASTVSVAPAGDRLWFPNDATAKVMRPPQPYSMARYRPSSTIYPASPSSHIRQPLAGHGQTLSRMPVSTSIPQWLDTIPPIKDHNPDKQFTSDSTHIGAMVKTINKFYPESEHGLSKDRQSLFHAHRTNHTINTFPTQWIAPAHAALNNSPHAAYKKAVEDQNICESEDEDFSLQMAMCPLSRTAKRQADGDVKVLQEQDDMLDSSSLKTDSPMPPLVPLHNSRPTSNESTGSNLAPTSGSEADDRESPDISDIVKINTQHLFGIPQRMHTRNFPTAGEIPAKKFFTETAYRNSQPEFIGILNEVHNCGRTIDSLLMKFESRHFTDDVLQLMDKYARLMRTLWDRYNDKADGVNSVVGVFEMNTDFIQDYLRLIMEYRSLLMRHYLKIENHQEAPNNRKRTLSRDQQLSPLIPNLNSSSWKFFSCSLPEYSSREVAGVNSQNGLSPPPKRRRLHEKCETNEDLQQTESQNQPAVDSPNSVGERERGTHKSRDQTENSDAIVIRENNCYPTVHMEVETSNMIHRSAAGRETGIKDDKNQTEPSKGSSYIMEQFALMDKQGCNCMTKEMLQDLSQKSGLPVKTIKRLYSANMVKNMCSKRLEMADTIRHSSMGLSEMH